MESNQPLLGRKFFFVNDYEYLICVIGEINAFGGFFTHRPIVEDPLFGNLLCISIMYNVIGH